MATSSCDCKITLPINIRNIPLDCKRAFQLCEIPLAKGIFQIDSKLGRQWGPRLKPKSLEDFSALIAIVRPGCLEVGISERFLKYRNSGETPTYDHPKLEPILRDTYGQMIYQEQMMKICSKIAGLDLKQSDILRRAVGKKLPKLIRKQKSVFLKGCKDNKCDKKVAERLWSEIEKGAGYVFNKSHSLAYSLLGYRTAFLKAHFHTNLLKALAKLSTEESDPQNEIAETIAECWRMGVRVTTPSLENLDPDWSVTGNNAIHYGSRSIKGLGEHKVKRLRKYTFENKGFAYDFVSLMCSCAKDTFQRLIKIGVFDRYNSNRDMLSEVALVLKDLKSDEIKILLESVTDNKKVREAINDVYDFVVGKGGRSKRRLKTLDTIKDRLFKAFELRMQLGKIGPLEVELLGTILSPKASDYYNERAGSHKCAELMLEQQGTEVTVFATVSELRPHTTKRGKQMGFVDLVDDTGIQKDVLVFPKNYFDWKSRLYTGATRLFSMKILDNSSQIVDFT